MNGAFVGTPVLDFLNGLHGSANSIATVVSARVLRPQDSFARGDRRQLAGTEHLDEALDGLNTAIKAYLTMLDPQAMTDADHRRAREILCFLGVGEPETTETSSLRLDALRNLKRVNAHMVAAAAYPVLENKGELLPNRLRHDEIGADG